MLFFIALQLCFLIANAELCDDDNSVDITDAEVQDNILVKDGVKFQPKYVYSKNVSGEIRKFGCVCEFNKCFRKCCPLGEVSYKNSSGKKCIKYDDPIQMYGLNVSYLNSFKGNVKFNNAGGYSFFYGIPCGGVVYKENDYDWFIQEDGSLYMDIPSHIPPWLVREPNKYCVDTFIFEDDNGTRTSTFDAVVCFGPDEDLSNYPLSASCMIISCVFILATVSVYAWLPELRNLHGRVLMAYLLSIFVAFIVLATLQIMLILNSIVQEYCTALTFIIYFSLLASFFWLNVMCFDIWWTFSGKRGIREMMSIKTKFCAYCVYAFGLPSILTIILLTLEFSGLPPHPLLPMIRQEGCFLSGKTKLIYLYGPIVILCVVNMVFFIMTALKIAEIKQQTAVLKSRESATHDRTNSERQRLWLYVKLFAVMGISWILEVISYMLPEANKIWCFTDAYNLLIGLLVFVIFVCKRKIFRLMKKRIKDQILQQKNEIGNMTMMQRHDIPQNLKDYKQRDSLDTIGTTCPDSDSNKGINTTNL